MREKEIAFKALDQLFKGIMELSQAEAKEKEVAEDTRDYSHTIYDVFNTLEEGQVAVGKNTGINIVKEGTNFLDDNGHPIAMVSVIIEDLYSLEDVPKKLNLVDASPALHFYQQGYTIQVDFEDQTFLFDHKNKYEMLPIQAIFDGVWYIQK